MVGVPGSELRIEYRAIILALRRIKHYNMVGCYFQPFFLPSRHQSNPALAGKGIEQTGRLLRGVNRIKRASPGDRFRRTPGRMS